MPDTSSPPRIDENSASNDSGNGKGGVFRLDASLDLTCADRLHDALQACIARDGDLLVDGGGVGRVSTACVQLLVAAASFVRAQGGTFRVCASSTVLTDAVRDLGLSQALGMETLA